MRTIGAIAFVLWSGAAFAQNTFPTPGGQLAQGIVNLCIVNGLAVPCAPTAPAAASLDRILADIDALRAEVQRLKICGTAGLRPVEAL